MSLDRLRHRYYITNLGIDSKDVGDAQSRRRMFFFLVRKDATELTSDNALKNCVQETVNKLKATYHPDATLGLLV